MVLNGITLVPLVEEIRAANMELLAHLYMDDEVFFGF